MAAAGKITSIVFTDSTKPTITLTAAQQSADAAALAKITSPYTLVITGGTVTAAKAATTTTAVAVSDTSANVLAYLAQLQTQAAAGRIISIAFTDSTTPTLSLTAAQLTADATVLGKISSAYDLSISGVTALNASTVAGTAHVTLITISDTAANVLANIAALQTLAAGTKLSSITLTNGTTPTLSLTSAQYAADTAALGKISSAYNLSITGVTAANAPTVAGNTHVTSITISDTATNVVANIAALQTLANGTKLSSIALSNSTTPTLSLTSAQYAADTAALGKISSAYNLSITGVTAANASSIAGKAHVTAINVSDTAANFRTNIAALQILATGGKLLQSPYGCSTPTLSLTEAQVTADAAALAKISSAYNLAVTGGGTEVLPSGISAKTITLQSASTAYTFTANSTPAVTIVDNGANGGDVITANAGDTVNVGGNGFDGNWDVINITGGTENVTANSDVYVNGSNNTITGGTNSQIGVSGTGDIVTTSGSVVWFDDDSGATSATVIGGNNSVLGSSGDQITVGGNGVGGDEYLL